jgi:hypothetical protein
LINYSSSKINLTQGALQRRNLLRGVRLGLLPFILGQPTALTSFNDSLLGEP